MPSGDEEADAGLPPADAVTLEFDGAVFHPDAVLATAHVLARTTRAWLAPDGRGGTTVRVAPAGGASREGLAGRFRDEAAAQELRRRVAAANRRLREYIITQALLSAGGEPAPAARAETPASGPQSGAEIERLIAEVEREIETKAARYEAGGGFGRAEEESGGADPSGPGPGRTP